jgi:NAD(P)-dependent dehydrogenase (short-subunit alcohol dehydrogenase family)
MNNLVGKTAFITGGASGIGLGMARAFRAEGMNVVIADVVPERLERAQQLLGSESALSVQVDVTDRESVASGAAAALDRFGSIDVVCANAGIGGGGGAAADPEWEGWARVMAVNLDGVVNTVKAIVPAMRDRGRGGHVVITSSVAGITALPFEHGAYTTSKFAVRGLGESLRLSLAEEGIGVSILCPGLTDTAILGGEHEETVEFQRIDGAMDALDVGYAVVRGIRDNAPYIFTHAEFADEFRQLFDELVAAVPTDQAVPADRAAFENGRRQLCDRLRHMTALD